MMKVLTTFMALALVLASVSVQNANAQLEISGGAGLNSPLGEYGDQAELGYSLAGGLGYRVIPWLSVGFELGYNGNKAPDEFTQAVGPDIEMSTSIFSYSGVAKLIYPVGRHGVFAKGSIGNYRGSAKVTTPLGEVSVNNTDLGYGFGGGFNFAGAKNSAFFVDVTYHTIAFDGADSNTNYVTFNVGATFMFDLFNQQEAEEEDDLREELKPLTN